MALLDTISDNFDDNSVGAIWTNNYGGAVETNQRARTPCSSGNYAGYQTSKIYTLAGSSIFVELVTVPAASTATDMNFAMGILSATDGTNLQFNISPVTGNMRFESNVAYFDAGATSVTFSAVTHRWLRFRETGGTLFWDTSTDGTNWTNRRSLTTPAWVTSGTDALGFEVFAYRDAGVADNGEFDNMNIAPAVNTVVAKSYINNQQAIRRTSLW